MVEIVGAGFDHNLQSISRELSKGKKCLFAYIHIPTVGHADTVNRQRSLDGAGKDTGWPGTECRKT